MRRIAQKKILLPAVVGAIIIGAAAGGWLWWQQQSPTDPESAQQAADTRRTCPDAWYEDRMPRAVPEGETPETGTRRQYFVVDGRRVEYQDMDVEWVKNNCPVNKPSPVY